MSLIVRIIEILIRTATSTIDITAIGIVSTSLAFGVSSHRFSDTYHTAMDGHRCILIGVAVLTAAIDRTLDGRCRSD